MGDTAGQVLEHDHHRIDERFDVFAASLSGGTPDAAAFTGGATALRHHIHVEETLHFPVLREAGLLAPVLVMLREHGEIWDLLDTIDEALVRADLTTVRATWPRLAHLLEQHNAKEERILYPAGDQTLSEETAHAVTTALASGSTPPGWTCEMAGRANP